MEKFLMSVRKVWIALAATLLLMGCRTPAAPALLSLQQQEGLAGYEDVYRACVSQAAATIDDGKSETIRVAAEARDYCEPERQDLAQFLDTTPLSPMARERYIRDVLDGAAGQSATALSHHRARLAMPRWPGLLKARFELGR